MNLSLVPRAAVLVALPLALGCESTRLTPPAPAASASASPAGSAPSLAVAPPAGFDQPGQVPTAWPIPGGPRLGISPGESFGPIHFGATLETVERLMESPCEQRSESLCRYIARAVEFHLKDGSVDEMRAYRADRRVEAGGGLYGVFNGRFRNGAAFNMHQGAVVELFGKPARVEVPKEPGVGGTVEIHHYSGLRLEYDRLANGNVVLGAATIVRP
ncbi:MAG: hypothetical protein FJ104_01115 [Deltaproteobacteria bacterium]|nr:hypothetical protein [Deltaproteobacteria bacterium]